MVGQRSVRALRPGRVSRPLVTLGLVLALLAAPRPARAAEPAAPPAPGRPPIAVVLPFANETGDPGLAWIGVALQDAINVDLWYVGALHTWDLPNMVGQVKQPPLSLAVADPAAVTKLAAGFGADLAVSGRYRVAGDQVTLTSRLARAGAGGPPAERTGSAPLGGLTALAARQVLELLDEANVPVGPDERARILIPKTRSADALRANAQGFEAYVRYGLGHDEAPLRESLKLFEAAVKADAGYAEAWNNLAWAQFVAEEYAEAVPNFDRAISLRVDLVDALVGLGKTKITANPEDASALPPLEAAVRLNPSLAGHRLELAEALEALGQEDRAAQELNAAERIVAGRIPYMEGSVQLRLAGLQFRKGDLNGAAARFERARDVFRASGSKAGEAGALRALGDLAGERRDFAAAQRYYAEALVLVRELGDRQGEGVLLNGMGMAALNSGNGADAERHFTEGLKASRAAGDKERQVVLLFNLGSVVAARGDLPSAQSLLTEALLLARQVGDQDAERAIQERLKQIRDALGGDETT